MSLKEYGVYIDILLNNFCDALTSNDNNKSKNLWHAIKYCLNKKDIPIQLLEFVRLMDNFFTSYSRDPVSTETLLLKHKLLSSM